MLSKILSATNYRTLVFYRELTVVGTTYNLSKFYDFGNIKNRYFLIKDIAFNLYVPSPAVFEVAYDNLLKTVNANTRYSIPSGGKKLVQGQLLSNNAFKIQINANENSIGFLTSNQYTFQSINLWKNIFAYIPNKLQSDFDVKITLVGSFVDTVGTIYVPDMEAIITGFSLDEDQLNNLKASDIQKVQVIDTSKQIKPSGILKNPQAPNKQEFFYD